MNLIERISHRNGYEIDVDMTTMSINVSKQDREHRNLYKLDLMSPQKIYELSCKNIRPQHFLNICRASECDFV